MKIDPKAMTAEALLDDADEMGRLLRGAFQGPISLHSLHCIQGAFEVMGKSLPIAYVHALAFALVAGASVLRIVPAPTLPLFFCFPFAISMVSCALDVLVAVLERRPWKALWMALWTVLLGFIVGYLLFAAWNLRFLEA